MEFGILNYEHGDMEELLIAIASYICICFVFYIFTSYFRIYRNYGHLENTKRVLFVIAHPDDECMFFGPIIVRLAQQCDCQMFLLCLSSGDYNNAGALRKQELWDSCEILGIPDNNITLYRCTKLKDDPQIRWREDIVASILLHQVESLGITTIITFDRYGVSSHKNHLSAFYATAYLCMEKKLPSYCRAYALDSVSVLRKYSALLDVPLSYLFASYLYIASLKERKKIQEAMQAHKSQYVWFRKLYITFSRYMLVNTLREIDYADIELDIDPSWKKDD